MSFALWILNIWLLFILVNQVNFISDKPSRSDNWNRVLMNAASGYCRPLLLILYFCEALLLCVWLYLNNLLYKFFQTFFQATAPTFHFLLFPASRLVTIERQKLIIKDDQGYMVKIWILLPLPRSVRFKLWNERLLGRERFIRFVGLPGMNPY